MQQLTKELVRTAVLVDAGPVQTFGELTMPTNARGVVVLVQGLGASWDHPRNQALTASLAREGLGALACDLFTPDEQAVDRITRHLRFDASLLAERAAAVVGWLRRQKRLAGLPIGLAGFGIGAAAALTASTTAPVIGVVCGARTQVAKDTLEAVECAALFIAGADDGDTIASHCRTVRQLQCASSTHLVKKTASLDEPLAQVEVAEVVAAWFAGCLERGGERAFASAA